MPRQTIVHILIRCDEQEEIDKCQINVEGNLSNQLMLKLIDYFILKMIENCEMVKQIDDK